MAMLAAVGMVGLTPYCSATRYHEARAVHANYRAIQQRHDLHGALVFVRQAGNVRDPRAQKEFGGAFMYNRPDFKGEGPIFAHDLGPASNRAIAANFPVRPIFFVLGRSPSVNRAHVIKGPISREDLQ